jgi:cyclophilin family peptidyl-prolyl cis-trans isomerase/HEAT repeat protein
VHLWSLFFLAPLAFAGDDALQQLAPLEWRRAPAADVVAAGREQAPEVRRAQATALGRLRDGEALGPLVAMRNDPDPEVRRAVAEALGYTPGAGPALRAWLDEEPASPWGDPASARDSLRPTLLGSLGHQAEADDIDRLVAALGEPWPASGAAAVALGRLGRARVEGVDRAVPALVAALERPSPRIAEAAAFGLYRVGLENAPAQADRAGAVWDQLPTGPARAWVLKAVWSQIEDRSALLARALADPEPVVRVAALDALQAGDVTAAQLAPLLEDDHPWVRRSATAALGRTDDPAVPRLLTSRAQKWTHWEAASAVSALAEAGSPMSAETGLRPEQSVPVRAAVAASLSDPVHLGDLAATDPEALVRTAAAGALLELEEVPAEVGRCLLQADDAAVREAAVALLEPWPSEEAVPVLVSRGLKESSPDVLGAILEQLGSRAGDGALPVEEAVLTEMLARTPQVGGRPGRLARDLARRLSVDPAFPPPQVPPELQVRLDDAAAIRSARVHTDRGEFRMELFPDVAPVAVANFARLAEDGFYDGLLFHRVVPAFVVQGGCPRGDGWGGPGWTIPDEVSQLPYDVGAVGMARAARDTGGSQWFVTLTPQPHLVGDYTLFGRVSHGMHVVKALQRGDHIQSVQIERVPPHAP